MPATEDRAISEFPRALELLAQALIEVSNPDGLGAYDTNSVELTELGRVILGVQYTQQLGNVSVFDAIKNTRVLSGTTTPLANEGANGQLYVKYETVSNVDNVVGMYFKKDGAWLEISLGGGGGSSYVELTQAEYDAMEQAGTLDPTVMYFITDGQSGGGATELADLTDVDLTSPTDGQLLRYNGTSGKWENAGIINDTTASSSSVYSSNKTDTLLSGKADFSDISATVSFGSDINASGSFKWVVKIGKLVYIYANLQPKENWTGGNKILLSSLPVRADYQESNYIPYIVGTQYFNGTTNEIRGAAVNGSNQLQTQNGANITTTNRIYINGFYRCQ